MSFTTCTGNSMIDDAPRCEECGEKLNSGESGDLCYECEEREEKLHLQYLRRHGCLGQDGE